MSTRTDASLKMLCCSGEKCPHQWVSVHRHTHTCSVFCIKYSYSLRICVLCIAHICSNQIMGWGEKAIEIRSVETGHLDGVFMHKRAQRLKFLCERNDKVIYFHTHTLHFTQWRKHKHK